MWGIVQGRQRSLPQYFPRPFGVAFRRTIVCVTAFAKAASLGGKP
jgi:hypothetical protein